MQLFHILKSSLKGFDSNCTNFVYSVFVPTHSGKILLQVPHVSYLQKYKIKLKTNELTTLVIDSKHIQIARTNTFSWIYYGANFMSLGGYQCNADWKSSSIHLTKINFNSVRTSPNWEFFKERTIASHSVWRHLRSNSIGKRGAKEYLQLAGSQRQVRFLLSCNLRIHFCNGRCKASLSLGSLHLHIPKFILNHWSSFISWTIRRKSKENCRSFLQEMHFWMRINLSYLERGCKQSIFYWEWFRNQRHSFGKLKTSQLQRKNNEVFSEKMNQVEACDKSYTAKRISELRVHSNTKKQRNIEKLNHSVTIATYLCLSCTLLWK